MDKAAILTEISKFKDDPSVKPLGAKLVERTKEVLEKGKKL
jgi:hypothetical protein